MGSGVGPAGNAGVADGEGARVGTGDGMGVGLDGGSGVTEMEMGVGGADSPLVSPTGAVDLDVEVSCSPSPHATNTERTKIARGKATRVERWCFKRHSPCNFAASERSS